MEFLNLTSSNLATEHICCAIADKKSAHAVEAKKEWLRCRIDEGLVFRKAGARGKVFIEYLPAGVAWAPVEAEGWMYINCLWVAGSYKGSGYGNELLDYCLADSRRKEMRGVVALASAKKRPFLGDKSFFVKHGFRVTDKADPWFELLALPFDTATPLPRFAASVHQEVPGQGEGADIWFTAQCPFATSYSAILADRAANEGFPVRLHPIRSTAEARSHFSPYTTFTLCINGKFITHEIPTPDKLTNMLKQSRL